METIHLASKSAKEALEKGSKVLIIGALPNNFSEELQNDLRLIFWDHEEEKKKDLFPRDVGLIFLVSALRKGRMKSRRELAKVCSIPCVGPLRVGQIKKILRKAFLQEAQPKQEHQVERFISVDYSELDDFILDNLTCFELSVLEDKAEIARIHSLARERWKNISKKRVIRAVKNCFDTLDIRESIPESQVEQSLKPSSEDQHLEARCEKCEESEKEFARLKKSYERLKRRERTLTSKYQNLSAQNRDLRAENLDLIAHLSAMHEFIYQ